MGRRHMPTGNSQGRFSLMASGKRASMREGPLAALFRKTEEDAARADADGEDVDEVGSAPRAVAPEPTPIDEIPPREVPHPSLAVGADAPKVEAEAEARIPSPQERLRHAFSSEMDLPDSFMDIPEPATS